MWVAEFELYYEIQSLTKLLEQEMELNKKNEILYNEKDEYYRKLEENYKLQKKYCKHLEKQNILLKALLKENGIACGKSSE